MKKIDCHQHFWRYNTVEFSWIDDTMRALRRDFLPDDLGRELEGAGFDGAVAVQARQSREETDWLLQLAEEHPFVLGVVGWVDLRSPDVGRELAVLKSHPKFVGVRHIVQDEPDDRFLLRPEFQRGVRCLEEMQLPYDLLIHARHLPVALQFVREFPGLRIVLNHLAKPPIRSRVISPWKDQMKSLAGFPNVFCKASGMVTEADWSAWRTEEFVPYLDAVFEFFGAGRMMIGSDWPVCTLGGSYREVLSIVMDYLHPFSESDKAAVLGGNAARVYGLTPVEKTQTSRRP